jgi:hypothetical protein
LSTTAEDLHAPQPANGTTEPDSDQHQPQLTPAEVLASSIYDFVKAASVLGVSLATVSADEEREDSTYPQPSNGGARSAEPADATESTSNSAESQVQLLRLRIKHQEIIIYPDQNYLCCVVQRIGQRRGTDGR